VKLQSAGGAGALQMWLRHPLALRSSFWSAPAPPALCNFTEPVRGVNLPQRIGSNWGICFFLALMCEITKRRRSRRTPNVAAPPSCAAQQLLECACSAGAL